MPTIADYYVQIVPSAEGIGSELSNIMDSEAGAAGAAASGSFGSKFSSGLLKSNLGAQAITAISKATVDFGKSAVTAGMEWETSFAQVQTIMDTTQMSTEDMSSAIQKLSSEMGISANELAGTVYNAISATGDTANSVALASQASKLATAGFTDTGSALSVLTTAMNAYGLSASEAENISDSLIQVQNLGVTTVSELASSMGKAIASASAYGVDLSNLESAYVSMTKSGINTAESTTYISSMLKELGDEGSDVSAILGEKTGKTFAELMNEGSSLGDVLGILNDAVDGDASALMNLWSSAEAGKASNAIISQGLQEFNNNLEQISSTAGTTESAYETMADTLEHKTDVFKTLGTNLLTSVYEGMSGELGTFVDLGNEALESLSNGFNEGGIDGLMSALGGVLSNVVGKIMEELPSIVEAGSALLGSLASGLISNLPVLAESALTIISNLANSLASGLPTIIPTITSIILEVSNILISNLPTIISAGIELFNGLVIGLIDAIPIIVEQLPILIDSVILALEEGAPMILDAGTTLFLALVDALPDVLIALTQALPTIIDSIVDFMTGEGSEDILESAIMMFMEIVAALPEILGSLLGALGQVMMALLNGIGKYATQMLTQGTMLMMKLGSGIVQAGSKVLSQVINTVKGWVNGITNTISQWSDAGSNIISGLWSGISNKAQWVYDQITGLGQGIINRVKSLFGIKSPSRVFAEIGGYLAEGLGEGWEDAMKDVNKKIGEDLNYKGHIEVDSNLTKLDNVAAVAKGQVAAVSTNNAPSLDGMVLQINETIDLGDTKLKSIVSDYVIRQIGTDMTAVKISRGGLM